MIDLLRANSPTLSSLVEPELLAEIQGLATIVAYADGQIVHQRGDAKPGLSLVKSGEVAAGNVGVDGSLLMTSVIAAGDCFGEFTLFAGLPRTHDVYSLGESEIYQVPRKPFLKLFRERPALAEAMLTLALHRNHGLLEYLDNLRRQPLLVRTAQILKANVPADVEVCEIPCRQDQLAFSLGVSRVSIGKTLATLQQAGLIELGYGKVTIPSTERLQRWLQDRTLLAPLHKNNS